MKQNEQTKNTRYWEAVHLRPTAGIQQGIAGILNNLCNTALRPYVVLIGRHLGGNMVKYVKRRMDRVIFLPHRLLLQGGVVLAWSGIDSHVSYVHSHT